MKYIILDTLQESVNVQDRFITENIDLIQKVADILASCITSGHKILIFGNGGSSATASHYQNDFNKGISEYVETKFNFHCLNDNIATLMAIANDIGFEEVFRFQLKDHFLKNQEKQ